MYKQLKINFVQNLMKKEVVRKVVFASKAKQSFKVTD